jgi:hypothetical protein
MVKINNTQEDKCARKMLGPWLGVISALIVVTVILAFYFAEDIRKSQANRGPMQIGGFKVPGQMGQTAKAAALLTAFVPPWHSKQNPDAVTGATPVVASFNQAIGVISPSVVSISTSGDQQQSASGVIVHHLGYVLTNNHVVKGAKNIVVTLSDDQLIKSYSAKVFDSRPDLDLAIIKINQTGKQVFSPAPLGDSGKVYIGEQIVAIGNQSAIRLVWRRVLRRGLSAMPIGPLLREIRFLTALFKPMHQLIPVPAVAPWLILKLR